MKQKSFLDNRIYLRQNLRRVERNLQYDARVREHTRCEMLAHDQPVLRVLVEVEAGTIYNFKKKIYHKNIARTAYSISRSHQGFMVNCKQPVLSYQSAASSTQLHSIQLLGTFVMYHKREVIRQSLKIKKAFLKSSSFYTLRRSYFIYGHRFVLNKV